MAEFDLQTIKKKMLRKYPAFGSTINNVEYKIVDDNVVKTAGTDGKTIYCNKKFLNTLSEDEQVFVFAHEVCHIALNHIGRSQNKNPRLWNIATDAVINAYLRKDGLPAIKGSVNIEDALNYDAEELYHKLVDEKKNKKQSMSKNKQHSSDSNQDEPKNGNGDGEGQGYNSGEQQSDDPSQGGNSGNKSTQSGQKPRQENDNKAADEQKQSGQDDYQSENDAENDTSESNANSKTNADDNSNNDSENENDEGNDEESEDEVGHDEHSMWKEAVKQAENKAKEKQENSSQKANKNSKENNENASNNECDDNQKEISEREIFKENEEQIFKQAESLMKRLTRGMGVNASPQDVHFGSVGKASKPVTNWKKVLKKTLNIEDEIWGHRFSDRLNNYAARLEDVEYEENAKTEIILDTSGSVSEELLRSFLRQVKSILKDSVIEVGTFADEFYGFTKIKTEADIDNLFLTSGFGTNFDAASRAFSKGKDINRICFTDGIDGGDAGIRTPRSDIIWISFGNPYFKPDRGKVIYVPVSEINLVQSQDEINKLL